MLCDSVFVSIIQFRCVECWTLLEVPHSERKKKKCLRMQRKFPVIWFCAFASNYGKSPAFTQALTLFGSLFGAAFDRENAKNGKFFSLSDIHIQCSCPCPPDNTTQSFLHVSPNEKKKTNENNKKSVEQKRKLKNEPYTEKTNRTKKSRMKIQIYMELHLFGNVSVQCFDEIEREKLNGTFKCLVYYVVHSSWVSNRGFSDPVWAACLCVQFVCIVL